MLLREGALLSNKIMWWCVEPFLLFLNPLNTKAQGGWGPRNIPRLPLQHGAVSFSPLHSQVDLLLFCVILVTLLTLILRNHLLPICELLGDDFFSDLFSSSFFSQFIFSNCRAWAGDGGAATKEQQGKPKSLQFFKKSLLWLPVSWADWFKNWSLFLNWFSLH